jgi:putative cardiolipin synthase
LVAIARIVFSLPGIDGRQVSSYIPARAETALGAVARSNAAAARGVSGMYPLFRGAEAFDARVTLARAAEVSIDAQYYIWHDDLTGLPLLAELKAAAERGVRVRLPVDDNGTPGLDSELSALNAMDNFEVRIFNPFKIRNPRLVSYLFDFPRLNRRMHNKSFTVDGAATIVGGRNIGDTYFSRASESQYSDFDLLLVGPAATDVSVNFGLFWNSGSSYPRAFLPAPDPAGLDHLYARLRDVEAAPGWPEYLQSISDSKLVTALKGGRLAMEWVPVTLVSDDPIKGLGNASPDKLMIVRLKNIVGQAESSIDLVSAYFIPGDVGTEVLVGAARKGAAVRTLTNSAEATDVLPVHAGYSRYRDRLIEGGVDVYELKAAESPTRSNELGLIGSSAASHHAKTFALDRNRVFVGSFNFDPRSAILNCEMGFLGLCCTKPLMSEVPLSPGGFIPRLL